MPTTIKAVSALVVSLSLLSCAVSKAIYLGPDDYSPRTGPALAGAPYHAENVNGRFPDAVYIKTRTQTFNLYHYYILDQGRIWYKSIDPEQEPADWTLLKKTGLPARGKAAAIAEISADADELVALSDEGSFFRYCFDRTIAHRSNAWLDKQGWPVEEQLSFDSRTANNRAWAMGKRNSHVLYYEDIFGNQHHNGTMEIATTYVLLEDGQEICYSDPGLPSDFSRNYIGPERGAFVAAALSASASTMFVINEAGEMYTRLADFDTIGCDPMWFKYTYIPYQSDLPGTSFFSNLNEWALPSEDWLPQPGIPLDGTAALTRHITILQNGQGNGARELRVAGIDAQGNTGYWSKPVFDGTWAFRAVPLYFADSAFLETGAQGERGLSLDKSYAGFRWEGGEQETDWEYRIPNFNILEGDCDFLVTWQGETCALKLYPVEMWTYLIRDYVPGRTGSPKLFLVTLEIPAHAFDTLSSAFVRQLTEKYARYDRKLFHFTIAASGSFIIMRETGDTGPLLYLTDGTVSSRYSELHVGRYIESYDEVQRFYSPDLTIGSSALTAEALTEKIALNKRFVQELKYKIRVMKWSQLTAFKINAGYLPAHNIIKFTPLRFVDMPKLRTMTSYGDTMVRANSAYVNTTTAARIRLLEKIIEMLDTRIRCYTDIAADPSGGSIIPPWYSDSITDYWDIAGLPRTIPGGFYAPGTGNRAAPIPAVLSVTAPLSEHTVSGWFLTVTEGGGITLFIESRNAAEAIYKRKGKAPGERKLRLDCTVYVSGNARTQAEQDILEHCLAPYTTAAADGINARIIYDGHTFEIREYPSKHGSFPVFQGTI